LIRLVLEGIVLYLTARGIAKLPELVAQLRNSRLGEGFAVWVEKNHQRLMSNPKLMQSSGAGGVAAKPVRTLTDHTTVKEQPRPGKKPNNVPMKRNLPEGMKASDNKSIREWYNEQTNPDKLNKLDKKWEQEGVPLQERSERIFNIRHEARLTARDYMQNPDEVAALRSRDLAKYGSPDGPTFPQEVQKHKNQGMTEDGAYQAVIDGASRTNAEFNAKFGITR
jgi:hypothetical protein